MGNFKVQVEASQEVTYTVDFGTGSWTVGDVTVTSDKTGTQTLSEIREHKEADGLIRQMRQRMPAILIKVRHQPI